MKKASEMILSCLAERKMSQRQLAACMNEDVRHLNQQLVRANDMKVERFIDVLEHLGYRVEIVDNDGIRKVSPEYANQIIESREPKGQFWTEENGKFIGIDNSDGDAWCEEFSSKERCFAWLNDVE